MVQFVHVLADGGSDLMSFPRPDSIEQLAIKVTAKGCKFKVEFTGDGIYSFSCNNDAGEITTKLCRPGPDNINVIDLVVREAYAKVTGQRTTRSSRRSRETTIGDDDEFDEDGSD